MKKRSYFRKRKFKRTSSRKLSPRDLSVLDFLWTWKVASTAMLGDWAYKDRSAWWVYKALRQLQSEHYIQLLPRGKNVDIELWALTDLGFEVVLLDRDDILFHHYRPHAPAHDYLATCLQLGRPRRTFELGTPIRRANFSAFKVNLVCNSHRNE